jgi:hypothetical protein
MATPRIGTLPSEDRLAIFNAAKQLQVDPYELGGFLSLESGQNMDPNIRGGAGGRYYGMIQFGPAEQQKYLDPSRMGKYTRAEQMPQAVQFLLDRGFKPGQMGIDKAYATVLGGNPNVSLNAKDSFGTSVAGALPRFRKGGDLYANAQRVLGDMPGDMPVAQQASSPAPRQAEAQDFLSSFKENLTAQLMQNLLTPQKSNAIDMLPGLFGLAGLTGPLGQ